MYLRSGLTLRSIDERASERERYDRGADIPKERRRDGSDGPSYQEQIEKRFARGLGRVGMVFCLWWLGMVF